MQVKIKKLVPSAIVPQYQTTQSAGVDLCALLTEPFRLYPGQRTQVPTGLAIELPEGYEAQIRPRSGLALKHGITVLNTPGTIDADYRGQIGVILINLNAHHYDIQPGERIAQMVIAPVVQAEFVTVDDLNSTDRGTGGFGSTGK